MGLKGEPLVHYQENTGRLGTWPLFTFISERQW